MSGRAAEVLEALTAGEAGFVTAAEMASLTRLSKTTIYRMIGSGELEAVRFRGSWRVTATSALRALSAGLGPAGEQDAVVLADRLRLLRCERGLSQPALAARCGLSPGTISKIECGRLPDRVTVTKLAAGLGVKVAALTGTRPAGPAGAGMKADTRALRPAAHARVTGSRRLRQGGT